MMFVESAEFEKIVQDELDSQESLLMFMESQIENSSISSMINNYVNFIIAYAEHGVAPEESINSGIKLMWKIHLLSPKKYRDDCLKRFGKVITPPDLKFTSAIDQDHLNSPRLKLLPTKLDAVEAFSDINFEKHFYLQYNFTKKIVKLIKQQLQKDDQIKCIQQWIQQYKYFMSLVGNENKNNTLVNDKQHRLIEPTDEIDLVWHCHMLNPQIYFSESKLLANGLFVNHFIDVEEVQTNNKQVSIVPIAEYSNQYDKKWSFMHCFSMMMSIVGLVIVLWHIHDSLSLNNNLNVIRVDNNDIESFTYNNSNINITCHESDKILCSYLNGLSTIFNITDSLLAAHDEAEFLDLLLDVYINNQHGTVFYVEEPNINITFADINDSYFADIYDSFSNESVLEELINLYGSDTCEQASLMDDSIVPVRMQTDPSENDINININFRSSCNGWIFVEFSSDFTMINTQSVSDVPLTIVNQINKYDTSTTSYFVLIGNIIDFGGSSIYYLRFEPVSSYNNTYCNADSTYCDKINSQQILGNALFYLSVTSNNDNISENSIWNEMNYGSSNTYFQYYSTADDIDYLYYVFINGYDNGYRYVHGEQDLIGKNSSINHKLRIGADQLFGKMIEYTQSDDEIKQSYIIGPYPSFRDILLYIGSGYKIDTNNSSNDDLDTSVYALVIIIIVILVCFCWCNSIQADSGHKKRGRDKCAGCAGCAGGDD